MKIKICGIKTLDEIKVINETMPDFIGFVFAKSKREIDIETAKILKTKLNPKIKSVGVFVDKNIDEIIKYKNIIEFAQLHCENYTEDDILTLKNAGLKVIKVIKVQKENYETETKADFILFDTYSKTQAGGLGKCFDWNIKIKTSVPYFIAGGINAQNISTMAKKLKPYGADISSGAEINGIKTKEKVADIIRIVKEENL